MLDGKSDGIDESCGNAPSSLGVVLRDDDGTGDGTSDEEVTGRDVGEKLRTTDGTLDGISGSIGTNEGP
jgi:hypothetical protein